MPDPEFTPTTANVRVAFGAAAGFPVMSIPERGRAFDRWLTAHDRTIAANALRDAADEIESHYPKDLWPEATSEERTAFNKWARDELGHGDGARFHVEGIRHALSLARLEASRLEQIGEDQ